MATVSRNHPILSNHSTGRDPFVVKRPVKRARDVNAMQRTVRKASVSATPATPNGRRLHVVDSTSVYIPDAEQERPSRDTAGYLNGIWRRTAETVNHDTIVLQYPAGRVSAELLSRHPSRVNGPGPFDRLEFDGTIERIKG
jgi:hypothetical protein